MKRITDEIREAIIRDSQHGDERSRVADRYNVSIGTVIKLVRGDEKSDWHHKRAYGKTLLSKC